MLSPWKQLSSSHGACLWERVRRGEGREGEFEDDAGLRCSQGSPYHLGSVSSFGLGDTWQNQAIWAEKLPLELRGHRATPGPEGSGVTGNLFTFLTSPQPLLSVDCVCAGSVCVREWRGRGKRENMSPAFKGIYKLQGEKALTLL